MALDRYTMHPDRLPALLEARGWLDRGDRRRESVHRALLQFQQWWGLLQDGWAGPVTERVLEAPRFCALPDRLELGGRVCKWPSPNVTWAITGSLPGFSDLDLKDIYAEAWARWAAVCGINPTYSTNARTANVLMGSGSIDGVSGTLAWSELPCGNPRQLEQRYDTREPWGVFDAGDNRSGKIDLVRVACHEIGHVIGLDHLRDGALLAPTYDRRIDRPQEQDIAEARKRYGAPQRPDPAPEPTPGESPSEAPETLTLAFGVKVGGWIYEGQADAQRTRKAA